MVGKEAVMVVVMVLSVALWLSIPPVLSRVMAPASFITRGRLRSMTGLRHRLVDVGDTWRALLLGAPPTLL